MNKTMLGIFALATLAVLAIGSVAAFGFGQGNALNQEEAQEHRGAIQNAIETNNYAEWEGLMQERLAKFEGEINQETFANMQQRHEQMSEVRELKDQFKEAIADDNTELAQELKTQIQELMPENKGFGIHKKGFRQGHGQGLMQGECPYAQ